jgi:phosphoglycolate phosphatase
MLRHGNLLWNESAFLVTPIIANSIRAVIFDLDGTLMDTSGEIAGALERTFGELGLPALSKQSVEALIGRGVPSLVERALAQVGGAGRDAPEVIERFEEHYARTVGTASDLFPGVRAALEAFERRHLPMGVVTNKPRFFTEKLLRLAGVEGFFRAVVAGDDGIPKKPRGDMLAAACRTMQSMPAETLMLGDSDNDILAARAAGCPVWCVPYGYNEGRPPEALACDRLVATLEEAAALVIESNRHA